MFSLLVVIEKKSALTAYGDKRQTTGFVPEHRGYLDYLMDRIDTSGNSSTGPEGMNSKRFLSMDFFQRSKNRHESSGDDRY
jgi:hypothetical protein